MFRHSYQITSSPRQDAPAYGPSARHSIHRNRSSSASSDNSSREPFPDFDRQYRFQGNDGKMLNPRRRDTIDRSEISIDLEEGEIRETTRTAAPATKRLDDLRRCSGLAGFKRSSQEYVDRDRKCSRTSRVTDVTASRRDGFVLNENLRLNQANCQPGVIFTAVVFEPIADQNLLRRHLGGKPDRNIFDAGADGYYIRKDRPWVVTAVYESSYQAIAVHTNGGEGLESRRHNQRLVHEYVRIDPPFERANSCGTSWMANENDVLTIATLIDEWEWRNHSYAWLSYPVSRRFQGKATIIGKLTEESLRTLMTLVKAHSPWERYEQQISRSSGDVTMDVGKPF